jgi:hypothetical protein
MLDWLKNLFREPTPEELLEGLRSFEYIHGYPLFPGKTCPFSKYVRKNGMETRQFTDTRHDN